MMRDLLELVCMVNLTRMIALMLTMMMAVAMMRLYVVVDVGDWCVFMWGCWIFDVC